MNTKSIHNTETRVNKNSSFEGGNKKQNKNKKIRISLSPSHLRWPLRFSNWTIFTHVVSKRSQLYIRCFLKRSWRFVTFKSVWRVQFEFASNWRKLDAITWKVTNGSSGPLQTKRGSSFSVKNYTSVRRRGQSWRSNLKIFRTAQSLNISDPDWKNYNEVNHSKSLYLWGGAKLIYVNFRVWSWTFLFIFYFSGNLKTSNLTGMQRHIIRGTDQQNNVTKSMFLLRELQ